MAAAAKLHVVEPEDRMRSDLYNYLGLLLARAPDSRILTQTANLTGNNSPLGMAIAELSRIAGVTTAEAAEREFNKLFIGLGRGELLPYASYYLTGFLNEKPLARLRNDMALRRIARSDTISEPEDNIASLMEIMGGMIVGRFGAVASLDDQIRFFEQHVGRWAGHFFSDLEAAKNAVFYAAVGAVGREFMEVEQEAFRMAAA